MRALLALVLVVLTPLLGLGQVVPVTPLPSPPPFVVDRPAVVDRPSIPASPPSTTPQPPAPPPPDSGKAAILADIKTYIDSEWTTNQSFFNSAINSGGGNDAGGAANQYYFMQWALQGWNAAHDVYGGTTYLERVLGYAETMITKATNTDSCGFKSWPGSYSATVGGCTWTNAGFLLNEFQGATEMAWVAGIILSDAGLTATYGSRATAVRDFVHDHVVRKWMARDQWGFLSTTPTSDKPYLLANIMLGLGRAGLTNTIFRTTMTYQQGIVVLLNSYLATVSAPSGPIATAGAELHHYKGYTGATFCGDAPNTVSPCSGDTEHENRIPHTIQRAVDMGYSSLVNMTPTGSTLEQHAPKLARLLGFVIWDRSTTLPRFTNYVDGANHHFRTRPPWDNGVIGMGWLHIAHHHADAISAGRSMLQCVRTGCASPSRARNAPVQARTGLAGTTALAVHRGP